MPLGAHVAEPDIPRRVRGLIADAAHVVEYRLADLESIKA